MSAACGCRSIIIALIGCDAPREQTRWLRFVNANAWCLLVHRDDSNIEVTSDPTGEIRVFVYTQKMPGTQTLPLAPDGTGGTAGVSDGQQPPQLKHTVTGERCATGEHASR
eukprot:COSAG02_NODE_6166_length_3754_cov_34.198906_2_plen_111_part_00